MEFSESVTKAAETVESAVVKTLEKLRSEKTKRTLKWIGIGLIVLVVGGSLIFGFSYKSKYEATLVLLENAQGSELLKTIRDAEEALLAAQVKIEVAEARAEELERIDDEREAGLSRMWDTLTATARDVTEARTGTDIARSALIGIQQTLFIMKEMER